MVVAREVSLQAADDAEATRSRREQHTFRGNLGGTRHGWLRLTPAYSVRLVRDLLGSATARTPVLDPFCGTGTTLLTCSERGTNCDTVDINPFLVWLAGAKVATYSSDELEAARRGLDRMRRAVTRSVSEAWVPPLHQIEKWWSPSTLAALSRAHRALERHAEAASARSIDLLRIAFCQVLIRASRADFGHQSMSFQQAAPGEAPAPREDVEAIAVGLREAFERVARAAATPLPATERRIVAADARRLHETLPRGRYGLVITSPPYANRMSYIRELRPYMYWLKYLESRTAAGVLDWKAIGGTWGSATSNLASWQPEAGAPPAPRALVPLLAGIAESSPLLSTYVRKYFHDMAQHLASLGRVMRRGGLACYVVGNSKFYDVVVPVEQLLAEQFERSGFQRVSVETLRKRSSKKELYEYLIRAEKA
jgi:DNA modification methylase